MQNLYVKLMMGVVGRSLAALTQTDATTRQEIATLPPAFTMEMKVLPRGCGFVLAKQDDNSLKLVSGDTAQKPQLSIGFKHLMHAFLVFSFQESTARSFANDRMVVDGDLGAAMTIVRCLNRMEATILPRFIAKRALKSYPSYPLRDKLVLALKVYGQFALNLIKAR